MTPTVGQVWKMTHSRKGSFTGRILTDPTDGDWLDVEIVAGKLLYASAESNLYRMMGHKGVPGLTEKMRTSFVTFVEKISD